MPKGELLIFPDVFLKTYNQSETIDLLISQLVLLALSWLKHHYRTTNTFGNLLTPLFPITCLSAVCHVTFEERILLVIFLVAIGAELTEGQNDSQPCRPNVFIPGESCRCINLIGFV